MHLVFSADRAIGSSRIGGGCCTAECIASYYATEGKNQRFELKLPAHVPHNCNDGMYAFM